MKRVNTRGIALATKHVLMASLTYNKVDIMLNIFVILQNILLCNRHKRLTHLSKGKDAACSAFNPTELEGFVSLIIVRRKFLKILVIKYHTLKIKKVP